MKFLVFLILIIFELLVSEETPSMFCWTFWPNTSRVSPHQAAFDTSADTVRETLGKDFCRTLWNSKEIQSDPKKSFDDDDDDVMQNI